MPLFEFTCEDCKKNFEAMVRSGEEIKAPCEHCGSCNTSRSFEGTRIGGAGGAKAGHDCGSHTGFT